jgi:hypothetical protein
MPVDSKVATNIIQILANLPDFLRKPILQNKLEEFYSMQYSDKRETISKILEAAAFIETKRLSILIRTWMEILSKFDGEKITTMLRIYCEEILKNPTTLQKLNTESLIEVFSTLEDRQKEILTNCLKEVILSFPNRYDMIKVIPEDALKILKIKYHRQSSL